MLKRSVRLKSSGTNGSLFCRTLNFFSNSVDMFFPLYEGIVETDKTVFEVYTTFEWNLLDVIFLTEFTDSDHCDPKLTSVIFTAVLFSVEKIFAVMVVIECISESTIKPSLSHSFSNKYREFIKMLSVGAQVKRLFKRFFFRFF